MYYRVRWDDPFGGTCQDTFDMSEDGQKLTQVTEMVMKTGEICNYKYGTLQHSSERPSHMHLLSILVCLPNDVSVERLAPANNVLLPHLDAHHPV